MGATATPQGFLLPVLGILLVTSEWSQRTALVTFTLMPVRGRVLLAKVLAALIAGLAAILLAIAVAAVATLLGGAPDAWAGIGADDFAKFGLLQVSGVLQGLAFGLLFLSSAAAIVTFFVLPTAFTIVANLWGALRDAAPWVDLGTAQQPLFSGTDLTGEQWLQVTTATLIWVVLPFVVGMVRVLRAEVK
jgi:ABC-2 type transport system permease protein